MDFVCVCVCHDILECVIGANCLTIHNVGCSRLPNWTAQQTTQSTTHISPSTNSISFGRTAVAILQ